MFIAQDQELERIKKAAIYGLGSIKMLNMIKNPEKGKHNDRNTQQI